MKIKIKNFLKKLKKPRFVMKGSCKKCGECCRNITFAAGKRYLHDEIGFERMKEFDSKYNNFFISGKDDNGTLLFTCKALGEDNICKSYGLRSLYCRLFPKIATKTINSNSATLDGCGYYFESNVKFEDYLDPQNL